MTAASADRAAVRVHYCPWCGEPVVNDKRCVVCGAKFNRALLDAAIAAAGED